MQKPLPPYGRSLKVPEQIPLLFLFTGQPDCWAHAKNHHARGLRYCLCLPDIDRVDQYFWPVENCSVIVILLVDVNSSMEARMMAELCRHNPVEVIVRHYPSPSLMVRRRRRHG